jgi:hypothetical protein
MAKLLSPRLVADGQIRAAHPWPKCQPTALGTAKNSPKAVKSEFGAFFIAKIFPLIAGC